MKQCKLVGMLLMVGLVPFHAAGSQPWQKLRTYTKTQWSKFNSKVAEIQQKIKEGKINRAQAIAALTALGVGAFAAARILAKARAGTEIVSGAKNDYNKELSEVFSSKNISNIIDFYHDIKNGTIPLTEISIDALNKAKTIAMKNNDMDAVRIANDLLNVKKGGTYQISLDTIIKMYIPK